MGHIRFDDEGAALIMHAVHRSDQPRTVLKPPRRSLQINTRFTPNAMAEEPKRKRRRIVDDRFGSFGDTRRQGKVKDGKLWKAHGLLSDPLASKQESTIRSAVSVAVAEVVEPRNAGGEAVSAKREKKRKRQSDVERVGGVAGEHAVKDAVGSAPAESIPVDTALSKEKKRFRKRDATAKKKSASAKAAANGMMEQFGETDYAPEATTETTNRKPKPRKPKKPRTDIEDTAMKHSPPADVTTEDIDQKAVQNLKVEVANPPPGEVMPQSTAKKQKRKHARHEDQSFAADPCLEGQTSTVRRPDSKKRKRHSLTVPTPRTEAEDAPAERRRPGVGDTIDTAGIVKREQSKPTNQNVPLPDPKVKIEADVQCNNQGQEPEGVHRRVPRSEIDFEKVIGEIQWALDDIQRVCPLLPHGYNKRTPSSAWLQEIRWNEEDALVRAWNIVCEKYVHGLPRRYYFATGDGWRRQYLQYVKKGEDAEEHLERLGRVLKIRKARAQGLKDHCWQLEVSATDGLANVGEQILRGPLPHPVLVGPHESIRSDSLSTILVGSIDVSIQEDMPLLRTHNSEPSRSNVRSDGGGDNLVIPEVDVHVDAVRSSLSSELQTLERSRPLAFPLDRARAPRASLPDPVQAGPAKGTFTTVERAAADDVLEYICQAHQLSYAELCGKFAGWKKLLPRELKVGLRSALPNRSAKAIRQFCEYRYVPRTIGLWTGEEDERSLKARTQHGNSWVSVADLVGTRSSQQCLQRYMDHLHLGDKGQKGACNQDELIKLVLVVLECTEQIKRANVDTVNHAIEMEELDDLVSWNVVSDKLGMQRSRKRARDKWQHLRRDCPNFADAVKNGHPPALVITALRHDWQSLAQRQAAARSRIFKKGDVYDVLVEIHTAITDHDKVYAEESSVWTTLVRKGSLFTRPQLRREYWQALQKYKGKKAVLAAGTIAGKAKAMAELMERHRKKRGNTFARACMPGQNAKKVDIPKESAEPREPDKPPARTRREVRKGRTAREPTSARLVKRKKVLPAEMVEDSDEEE
ncbi:hypothetical protein LTR35_006178 [Friedmanniomyces endolithicus]|uniref:Myb-like domain-containing protein n=1 Tax=Friedmanniomyces endolithicus TaxID=329885 RepID=A0AAN6FRS3_9PEZI|nr:hypothetical protein LTR35_006178 [Friedmanniomyces endolithicus]KAK0301346.1 hypothetical protein LTS00_000495 [Friedmanniomyces endolithicus]KAK0322262.1 hypothetical protein LTR82_006715 [Friedmanniomyces endolithicus]KAK1014468.1 hypothetical protein LTR54_004120 [Friedmanniomyces endolithicus]